jgi:arsenate reductase
MKATIYHNPMCGTSRKTLEILRDRGCDIRIHEYMKSPPSREELVRLYQRAGISPREGLRAKEPLAEELGLTRPDVTDDEVLDAMIEHPTLINRPIVETTKGVRLCRPQEVVREII